MQAITLKSYPVELSLTAYICFMGSIESTIVALFIERGNPAAWAIQLDSKLLAAVYGVSLVILIQNYRLISVIYV